MAAWMRGFLVAAVLFLAGSASALGLVPNVPRAIDIGAFDAETMLPAVQSFLDQVAAGQKDVVFRISSPGGSVFLGLDVIQFIEDVKKASGVRTTCVVDTRAYSMALVFLESGACDLRLMTRRATLLGHNASAEISGNAAEIHNTEGFLRALSEAMAEIVVARTAVPVATYLKRIEHADWVMSWREAVFFGFVDGIVAPSDVPGVL